jgi:hypothetical protein
MDRSTEGYCGPPLLETRGTNDEASVLRGRDRSGRQWEGATVKRRFLILFAPLIAALTVVATASARPNELSYPSNSDFVASEITGPPSYQLWHASNWDAIASKIAGFPLEVDYSDNLAEWNYLTGVEPNAPYVVDGFTYTFAQPGTTMLNASDGRRYNVYHNIWLSPDIASYLNKTYTYPLSYADAQHFARGLLTLDHESQHQRLHSNDEAYVNACALKDMPRLLQDDLKMSPTVTKNIAVPVTSRVRQRYRATVNHHRVWRYRYVWRTHYVNQLQTLPNPDYDRILSGAQYDYDHSPPPYNQGTC